MAINARSVQKQYYNVGLLPDIVLLTQGYYYHRGRNPFKGHEEVLSLQPMTQVNNIFKHAV